jgi:hypothetical protein
LCFDYKILCRRISKTRRILIRKLIHRRIYNQIPFNSNYSYSGGNSGRTSFGSYFVLSFFS